MSWFFQPLLPAGAQLLAGGPQSAAVGTAVETDTAFALERATLVRTRYVNPDSSGGNGTTAALSGANAAYASLNLCLALEAADLVAADVYLEVFCATNGSADGAVYVDSADGWVCDATRNIRIRAAEGHRAGTKWNTSKYRIEAGLTCITSTVPYTHIDGLQVRVTFDDNGLWCFGFSAVGCVVSNCLGRLLDGTLTYGNGCGYITGPVDQDGVDDAPTIVYNSVFYGGPSNRAISGIRADNSWLEVYNCTLSGNGYTGSIGIRDSYGHVTAKNNLVEDFETPFHGPFDETDYNATDTTSSYVGANGRQSQTFSFVAADDFALTGSDAGARDYGVTDPSSGMFTDDMLGTTRTGAWDIGAHEYTAASTLLAGRADETDAGLALTKRKTRGPATATEADTALAATKRKVRAVGLGAESDSAIDLSRRKARGALLGAEGDSAQAAGRRKARSTSAAAEIDSALGLSRRKSRSATLAAEGDAALSLTRRKTRAIGPAAETDAALELGPASGITVGTANETDSALALTRRKAKSATSAIETDTAQAPTRRKMRVAAQANEIDTALGPARRKTRTTAQAAETDAAQALTRRKTRTAAVAVESDTASARARLKRRAAGRADETDTAIARSPPGLIALPVGAATETDAALALARAQPGAAASQASRVSKARIRPAAQWLGPAPFVPAPQRVRVQMATEKSMAFALTRTPPDYSRHIALLLLSAA